MGKRKRSCTTAEQRDDLTEAVIAAVRHRERELIDGQSTLTLRAVRRLIEEDLGLPNCALDRPSLKASVSQAVDAILARDQASQPAAAPGPASAHAPELPADVLPLVLQHLDHDTLFIAAAACKAWRAATGDETLWQKLCHRHGWELPQPWRQAGQQAGRHAQQGSILSGSTVGSSSQRSTPSSIIAGQREDHQPTAPAGASQPLQAGGGAGSSGSGGSQLDQSKTDGPPGRALRPGMSLPQLGALSNSSRSLQPTQQQGRGQPGAQQAEQGMASPPPSWRALYRDQYSSSCYECWQPCTRTTLTFAPLHLRLCRACCQGKAAPRPHHRLVSKTHAKWRYCLRDADLAGLPYALDANPINPSFQAQTLFRRVDIEGVAVGRWGSLEAAAMEHCRRMR